MNAQIRIATAIFVVVLVDDGEIQVERYLSPGKKDVHLLPSGNKINLE